jgi:hypothetical protein
MLRDKDDKTRLSYWFPLIEKAGLPVPRTEIITTDLPLVNLCGGDPIKGFSRFAMQIRDACARMGLPCFLRTDFTSGKHYWENTCCITSDELPNIKGHIYELVEFSECADIMGLPSDVWAVREMLRTRPMSYAFRGRMPIVREFRFFVQDGKVTHEQPYWPPEAIENSQPTFDWRQHLGEASSILEAEYLHLCASSAKACAAVGGGYWSVDWLETVDRGWVLTDMAEGEHSYKWGNGVKIREAV